MMRKMAKMEKMTTQRLTFLITKQKLFSPQKWLKLVLIFEMFNSIQSLVDDNMQVSYYRSEWQWNEWYVTYGSNLECNIGIIIKKLQRYNLLKKDILPPNDNEDKEVSTLI